MKFMIIVCIVNNNNINQIRMLLYHAGVINLMEAFDCVKQTNIKFFMNFIIKVMKKGTLARFGVWRSTNLYKLKSDFTY